MIHESDYSHIDSLSKKKNLHAAIHLPNAPCVLLVSILKLLQTRFCETGLKALRNTEATGHVRSLM